MYELSAKEISPTSGILGKNSRTMHEISSIQSPSFSTSSIHFVRASSDSTMDILISVKVAQEDKLRLNSLGTYVRALSTSSTTSSLDNISHIPSDANTIKPSVSIRGYDLIIGSAIIPISFPLLSPKDLLMARPGFCVPDSKTRKGPSRLPSISGSYFMLPRRSLMRLLSSGS